MICKDILIELIRGAKKNTKGANCDLEREHLFADYLIENGVIVLPCKIGDYIEWDKGGGIGKTLYQVKGFLYYKNSLRYVLDFFEPVVTHQAITGILTKEEAEQALKGGVDSDNK